MKFTEKALHYKASWKCLTWREEPDNNLSVMNSKACVMRIQSTVTCSIHVVMILDKGTLDVWHHINVKIPSGTTVRGEGDVAGEGKLVGVPNFILVQVHHAINEDPVRLVVQCFLCPVYVNLSYFIFFIYSSITTCQDALKWLVLHVYYESNTIEFSAT